MFTDSIEIKWRTSTNSSLSSNGLNFTIPNNPETEKVYLIQKNEKGKVLRDQINQFLVTDKIAISKLYEGAIHQKYDLPKDKCNL